VGGPRIAASISSATCSVSVGNFVGQSDEEQGNRLLAFNRRLVAFAAFVVKEEDIAGVKVGNGSMRRSNAEMPNSVRIISWLKRGGRA
jgi:hypothetical protein